MITPYKFEKTSKTEYTYTRDDNIEYEVTFEESQKQFKDSCKNCSNIWEVCWLGTNDKAKLDVRSGRTLVEIIKDFLKDENNDAVLYKLYNDEKIEKRESLFNRLIKNYAEDYLEKICNENSVEELSDRLCLIIKKGSQNYNDSIEDIKNRCKECEEENQAMLTTHEQ